MRHELQDRASILRGALIWEIEYGHFSSHKKHQSGWFELAKCTSCKTMYIGDASFDVTECFAEEKKRKEEAWNTCDSALKTTWWQPRQHSMCVALVQFRNIYSCSQINITHKLFSRGTFVTWDAWESPKRAYKAWNIGMYEFFYPSFWWPSQTWLYI